MPGLNIDQILRDLEKEKTAEDIFAEGIQDAPVAAPVAEPVVEVAPVVEPVVESVPAVTEPAAEPVAEPVVETPVSEPVVEPVAEVVTEPVVEPVVEAVVTETEKTAELEKVAAELDAQGRIMARAFMDEIIKIANYLEQPENVEAPVAPEVVEEQEKVAADDPLVKILTTLYQNNF